MTTIILCAILGSIVTTAVIIALKPRPPKSKVLVDYSDDLLYDPETGAKITLEQAESGIWNIPDQDLADLYEKEQLDITNYDEVAAQKMREYLKGQGYHHKKFTNDELDILDGLALLNTYNDWYYREKYVFTKDEEIVFLPVVSQLAHKTTYSNTQLMFWIKIKSAGGHYYFTPKMEVEKVLNFAVKDEFGLKNYKATALKKTNGQSVSRIVKMFDEVKDIELETTGNNLFIKTLKPPTLEEYSKIKSIIDTIL